MAVLVVAGQIAAQQAFFVEQPRGHQNNED